MQAVSSLRRLKKASLKKKVLLTDLLLIPLRGSSPGLGADP